MSCIERANTILARSKTIEKQKRDKVKQFVALLFWTHKIQIMPLNKSWHDYNESLIERGRILMDISFLGSYKKEIKNMNKGKVGAAFEYSSTYIQFLAFLKIGFKISYRTVQGIVRGLSDYIKIEEIHFTQIRRRILKVKPSVGNLNLDNDDDDDDDNKPITLIVDDASGLTIKKRRLYRTKMDQEEKRVYQTTYCSRCKIKEGSFIQSN